VFTEPRPLARLYGRAVASLFCLLTHNRPGISAREAPGWWENQSSAFPGFSRHFPDVFYFYAFMHNSWQTFTMATAWISARYHSRSICGKRWVVGGVRVTMVLLA